MSHPQRLPVLDRRRSGVLLHPSSLLQEHGAGAFGSDAYRFIDWLAEAGFTVWQVLPLGPTGSDGSPYWTRSDQAGNPQFINPQLEPPGGHDAFEHWRHTQRHWLDDYALFEALAASMQGAPWWHWPEPLRTRQPDALAQAARHLHEPIAQLQHQQWQFAHQWAALRAHAHARGVRLFGDLPIYVAPDSVATWAQPQQFQLDAHGRGTEVAGVPPDYFSEDGQLWGNPLYDWQQMQSDGFAFWRQRLAGQLARYDLLRIDHFRALAAYWAVPADATTAREGRWRDAPGAAMLQAVRDELPDLPLVAEDLGVITPDVDALRRQFALPGMRVLQFAFGGDAGNPHLPHNHTPDLLVYSGTHDNDTTAGWALNLDPGTRQHARHYLHCDDNSLAQAVQRATLASVAGLAILPLQDVLGLDSAARLNTPGTVKGNWRWRAPLSTLTASLAAQCRELNALYGRV